MAVGLLTLEGAMTSDDGYEQLGYEKPSSGHMGWVGQSPPSIRRGSLMEPGARQAGGNRREGHLPRAWGPMVWLGQEDRAPHTPKVGAPRLAVGPCED